MRGECFLLTLCIGAQVIDQRRAGDGERVNRRIQPTAQEKFQIVEFFCAQHRAQRFDCRIGIGARGIDPGDGIGMPIIEIMLAKMRPIGSDPRAGILDRIDRPHARQIVALHLVRSGQRGHIAVGHALEFADRCHAILDQPVNGACAQQGAANHQRGQQRLNRQQRDQHAAQLHRDRQSRARLKPQRTHQR